MTRSALHNGYLNIAAIAACAMISGTAWAADYPTRSVRLIVPFASGSATDTSARIYASELSKQMGQQFLVDNRPGAGGEQSGGTSSNLVSKWLRYGPDIVDVGGLEGVHWRQNPFKKRPRAKNGVWGRRGPGIDDFRSTEVSENPWCA